MEIYPSQRAACFPNLGVGSLNIREAAALVAKCMACNGEIETNYEVAEVSLYDKKLEESLKKHIDAFEKRFLNAIEKGSLKSPLIKRDLDDRIISQETYVSCQVLEEWLNDRGIDLGDLYYEDYLDSQIKLVEHLEAVIEEQRILADNPEITALSKTTDFNEEYCITLLARIRDLEEKTKETPQSQKSLSTKTRETALKLIIGMAVAGYKYDPKANKNQAVKDIADDLALLGIGLDVDTVRSWLRQATETLPQIE